MENFPFVLLRCPAFSLNDLNLNDFKKIEFFKESIYIASKSLYDSVYKYHPTDTKKIHKLEKSLYKYWNRSCSRPTPYGLFSGASFVSLSDRNTHLVLNERAKFSRLYRVDMGWLSLLKDWLLTNNELRKKLKFSPNNSLYRLKNEYRYIDFSLENGLRNYKVSSVAYTDYLDKILSFSSIGKRTIDISAFLSENEDVSLEDANDYIDELISERILVSDLEPNVTGHDSLRLMIDKVKQADPDFEILNSLENINKLLNQPIHTTSHLQLLKAKINDIPVNTNDVLHVDLGLTLEKANVDQHYIKNIVKQLEELCVFRRQFDTYDLNQFRSLFKQKYGHDSVPLVDALDNDNGIGYGNAPDEFGDIGLLENLQFPQHKSANMENIKVDYIQRFALRKYDEYVNSKSDYISISEDDLAEFKKFDSDLSLPNSMYTMGSIVREIDDSGNAKLLFDFGLIGGPNAASLMARFSSNDNQLLDALKTTLDQEESEHPDAIYAEIVHVPQARVGNILQRPILRDFEVPYIGVSTLEQKFQISIKDLLIYIEDDEIILQSIHHRKRIIPRLTTAHNFMVGSLPIYKFLCDLQTQHKSYPKFWDWGLLSNFEYLPRVIYKDIIIHKARWIVSYDDMTKLSYTVTDQEKLKALFIRRSIPSKVNIKINNNIFFIDINNEKSLTLITDFVCKNKRIEVYENLVSIENAIVKDTQNNSYNNEIIIPLYNNNQSQRYDSRKLLSNFRETKFFPGSKWLSIKVYSNENSLSDVLNTIHENLIPMNLKYNMYSKFFFVRYKDPDMHLRLRFSLFGTDSTVKFYEIFHKLMEPYIKDNKIKNIIIEPYNRENGRYGKKFMDEAETLFSNDSLFAMKIRASYGSQPIDPNYYAIVAKSIDVLFDDFQIDLSDKKKINLHILNSFYKEFEVNSYLRKQLNDIYREYRKDIEHCFNAENRSSLLEIMYETLNERSRLNSVPIIKIIENSNKNYKNLVYNTFPSYSHMSINRLFTNFQRRHEMIIHHILDKVYNSYLFS